MFFKQEFGIDLGTDTVKIYDKKTDTISVEKNLIAVRNKSKVFSVGNAAYDMVNRTPADMEVLTPVSGGKINDIRFTEAIIHLLLFEQKHYIGHRPSIYFAVPTDMSEIERRAYASIARRGKLKDCSVYLVEKPIADALAIGIPVKKAKGSMMINIGAVSSELSVIAEANVILSRSEPIGGRRFDESIVAAVRRKNLLSISIKSAEQLKISFLGSDSPPLVLSVEGIDVATGLPRSGSITKGTVEKAVMACIDELTGSLLNFLERIPPQVRSTISTEGIYLTGGGSRIKGLDIRLFKRLGYNIHLSSQFQLCTVNGVKEVIMHSDANSLAYTPLQLKRRYYG